MKEYVSFTYKSIGNAVRLFATIQFEKTESAEDIAIWHERFDNDEAADDLFEMFLEELFPEGGTINPEDIPAIIHHAKKFMEKDKKAREIRNRYTKFKSPYWVYFKPTDTVYPCGFCEHQKTVIEICKEFFKSFDEVDVDYLEKFIKENFEICSDNTTVTKIAKDAHFIAWEIISPRFERSLS